MKKILLVLVVLMVGLSLNTKAQTFSAVNNGKTINYNITSSVSPLTVEVGNNTTISGDVIIPDSVLYNGNYYKVTSIGYSAFAGCNGLISVTIPNSVITIEYGAFLSCQYMTFVYVGNSVISIGGSAFAGCPITSIIIPNSVTSIGANAFERSGLTSVTIPNSVTSIGYMAFAGCNGLTSLTIPNSVSYIGDEAFSYCIGLSSVIIGNSVSHIGKLAFAYCEALTSITIPNSVSDIGDEAFLGCIGLYSINVDTNNMRYSSNNGILYSKNIDTVFVFPGGKAGNITIPNSVSTIYNSAFFNCPQLTSISMSNSVTSIGSNAFRDSHNLTSVIMSNSVNRIENYTFSGCWNLPSIILPDSILSIGNYAFEGCSGLTSLKISENVATIGGYAFSDCYNISSITCQPTTPPTIGANVFRNIPSTTPIYVPCSALPSYQSAQIWNIFPNLTTYTYDTSLYATICQGDYYTLNDFNQNEAGIYIKNLQTLNGCDSIVNLNLIVNTIFNDTIFAEICSNEPYTLNGFNESTTGFYTQNLQTINGCDSIVNLSLIVNSISIAIHYDTICKGEGYNNYGFNFVADTSGIYIKNLQTIKGCDSIVNLNLIVNPIFNNTIIAEICQGETYNQYGFNENITGFYIQNLQTIYGCDSIINLSLIVNPIYNDTIHAEICSNEIYTLNGFNFNTTGLYTQNLQTIKGCDSIVNLSLIVNPIYNDTITAIICQGDTYSENGFNANTTGYYAQNLQAINGCDSIIQLNLQVIKPPKVELEMVTVDLNNHNEVIWNKNEMVNHYNIYREGIVMGQFDLIATVPYDSVSMFIDTNSNPMVKSYMYKISTTDTCLNESELSPFHKTMHLTIGQGMGNNWNLNWTPYEGTSYTTYNIYRGINTLDSLKYLTTISASNTSYTDVNVPSGYVYYQVEILKDTTTSNKAVEINSIRSNYATNNTNSINNISSSNITTKLYPNPTNNKSKLEVEGLKSEADVLVYDMIGRVIQTHKINKGNNELEIDLSGYSKGVYSIRILNDSINQTKKLIVK